MTSTPEEQILAWLARRTSELPAVASREPSFTARFLLDHFVRRVNKGTGRLSIANVAELLGKLEAPEAAWALGLIWLWPRRISEGHFRDVLSRVGEASPATLMLRLFRDAGGKIESCYQLAGATVRADPRSVSALHGILLERAMIAGVRFNEEDWLRDIVPKLREPLVWSAHENDGLTSVIYGPLTEEQPDDPPWPPSRNSKRLELDGYRFWVVKYQRQRQGKIQVGVCHPVELSAARRRALREAVAAAGEPFEQIHREVHAPTAHSDSAHLVTCFRDQDIEDVHVFSSLRKRGWRRGQIMDFGRFFEMSLTIPELGWQPYVRLFPGIAASGPEGVLQYIHAVGFQKGSTGEVPWGSDFIAHTGVIFDGKPLSLSIYLDAPSAPEKLVVFGPEDTWGEELSKVPPVVYSETLRTLWQVLNAHGRPCPFPVTNDSRFFDLKTRGR